MYKRTEFLYFSTLKYELILFLTLLAHKEMTNCNLITMLYSYLVSTRTRWLTCARSQLTAVKQE